MSISAGLIHCKSCRREKTPEEFKTPKKTYKTCNPCRKKKYKKITIKDCKEYALNKGGECLSESYKNAHAKMKWKCSEGHEWTAVFNSVKRGHWCAECVGLKPLTIEDCKEYALTKGGECLSKTYKNNQTKMKWKCSEGHEWTAVFNNVKRGHWCAECVGLKPLTIKDCKEYALTKGGECLSESYKNAHAKMKWKCSEGHEWTAIFNSIKQGSWCPECSSGRSEQLCREIFEKYLLEKFPNTRPDWLGGLELDGYNEALNIAFEYNGRQHYKYIPFFHRNSIEDFKAQQERDRRKYKLCKEKGLKLILIPYKFNCYNPEELENFIYDALCLIC